MAGSMQLSVLPVGFVRENYFNCCKNTYIKNFFFVLVLADSLMHRAAAAEMMYLLEADKKLEAIKLIEDSKNNIASG